MALNFFVNTAPTLTLAITPSGPASEGQTFSLSCDLIGDESLAVTNRRFRWDRETPTFQKGIHTGQTLSFNPLSRDDDGQYRCTTTINSTYLTATRTEITAETITVNRKS